MRALTYKTSFKKNLALMKRRGKDINELSHIISLLQFDIQIPARHRDHALSGSFSGFRECHIQPDWLLIYKKSSSTSGNTGLFIEAT
jgi:mRNA interferase YafQ